MSIEEVTPVDQEDLHRQIEILPIPAGYPKDPPQFAVYRGCANAGWSLEHSLSRTAGDFAAKEKPILKSFRDFSVQELKEAGIDTTNDLQVMALGQHYGVPTRLLDWSRDPNVALHFATANPSHASDDGAVWVVNPHLVHANLPEMVRRKLCPSRPDDPMIIEYSAVIDLYPNISDFDMHYIHGSFMPAIFFEPARLDPRIANQKGLFSLVASAEADIYEVLDALEGACRKVIVPADLKQELRETLDARSLDERSYFPGMDGVGRFLTRCRAD